MDLKGKYICCCYDNKNNVVLTFVNDSYFLITQDLLKVVKRFQCIVKILITDDEKNFDDWFYI